MAKVNVDAPILVQRMGNRIIVDLMEDSLVHRADQDRVCAAIERLIDERTRPLIILSFEHVHHLSSTFLGKLIAMNKRVKQRKGELLLVNINPHLHEIFRLTRIDTQIPIRSTTGEAIAGRSDLGGAWFTAQIALALSALIGLGVICRIVTTGWPAGATRSIAAAYFLVTIPLAAALALGRLRFARLGNGAQWAIAGAAVALGALLLAAYLLAG